VPVAVAADRQRVDPRDLVAGGQQRPHQQPPVGLDADHDLLGVLGMAGHQRVQLGHAGQPLRDPALGQHRALLIQQAEVVVALGPVHPYKQHWHPPQGRGILLCEPEKDRGALMAVLVARHPTSRSGLLADQPGHALPQELKRLRKYLQCSPASGSAVASHRSSCGPIRRPPPPGPPPLPLPAGGGGAHEERPLGVEGPSRAAGHGRAGVAADDPAWSRGATSWSCWSSVAWPSRWASRCSSPAGSWSRTRATSASDAWRSSTTTSSRARVALLQPGAAALGRLLVIELARVGHRRSPPPAAAGGAGQPQPGAAPDAHPAGALVAQFVGGIIKTATNDPATNQPQATLAWAGPADANSGAGGEDAPANPHGGAPFSCSERRGHGAASLGSRVGWWPLPAARRARSSRSSA
jgi:hypothetical protein